MTPEWVRIPVGWIASHGLKDFKWVNSGPGADQVAALMTLVAIAHCADQEIGAMRSNCSPTPMRAWMCSKR
jgi:hypothetical protein